MLTKIKETTEFIKKSIDFNADLAIILGTGLGGLVDEIDITHKIEYKDIPNFPLSTVQGHKGVLIFGKIAGKNIIAMQGRFHFYEGYSMQEITLPVRVLKMLGIKTLIVSNASGGMNPDFKVGDLMIINDHINLFGTSPLIGPNFEELGPRFPDMSQAYDKELINRALTIGKQENIDLKIGVYAGVTGPTFETPAEYNYIRSTGADAVGMSTVPEVIVARHMGLTCFAISVITDSGVPGEIVEISHEEVQEVAAIAGPKMALLIKKFVEII
ncbi:MAG: purine-nucleoside phosphorylase [Bacteroidales bacterium]|nr:purine-nucleoside phosphorylase [Bacteroidales bacterium]MBN2757009.1 purine-nucleoside phosphorylase [Bacteroidales bacterium]